MQAEDFEAAATHSADLDAAKLVQRLQHDLRIAEGHLAAMVSSSIYLHKWGKVNTKPTSKQQ